MGDYHLRSWVTGRKPLSDGTDLLSWTVRISDKPDPIPEGSMRVGPGTDAVVWNTCKTHKGRPA